MTLRLRGDGLALRPVDGEVVLLCLRTSTYFTVNRSGAVVLDALRAGTDDRAELARTLADVFDLDDDTATADVDAFLAELADAGLLAAGTELGAAMDGTRSRLPPIRLPR